MVVGTLSLVQKGQTSGCSVHSGKVVYGGGDIVFGGKRSHSIHCSQHFLCAYHYS